MENRNVLLNEENLSEIEKLKLIQLQNKIDKLYTDAAKLAFVQITCQVGHLAMLSPNVCQFPTIY